MAAKGSKRTAEADAMAERATDELAVLGNVTARAMFGGYGVYADGVMFAIVDPEGSLFLRADDSTSARYVEAGSPKHAGMPYWGVPAKALDDADALLALAREAVSVAVASKSKRKRISSCICILPLSQEVEGSALFPGPKRGIMERPSHYSLVLETPAASPQEASKYFLAKLSVETDPADLARDLQLGHDGFILVDARDAKAYEECHLPTAIHLSSRRINAESTAALSKDKVVVTYCWGPACNGATKAAASFAELGFRVKELIGGIEYWRKEGGKVEGTLAEKAPLYWQMSS